MFENQAGALKNKAMWANMKVNYFLVNYIHITIKYTSMLKFLQKVSCCLHIVDDHHYGSHGLDCLRNNLPEILQRVERK